MNASSPERVHGLFIANASLLKSLISVLPLEALQALLPELERDTEFAKGFLLAQGLSDAAIEAHEIQADQNLKLVREQLHQKELLQRPDGVQQWMRERLQSTDED